MSHEALATTPELPLQKLDIYTEYILPYIEDSQAGDEVLFITPSTFFGFYSLGAHVFERVCQALGDAKSRGVGVRCIVDVHDAFSAKAAEGLCTVLFPDKELRHLGGNINVYYIMVYKRQGGSKLAEFFSEQPLALLYLPGIQIRPFRGLKGDPSQPLSDDAASVHREEFYQIWERLDGGIRDEIARHSPVYTVKRYFALYQGLIWTLVLSLGLIIGSAFAVQDQPDPALNTVLIWLVASLGTGVVGNYLSDIVFRRVFE